MSNPPLSAAVIVPPLHDFYFTRHRFSCLGAAIVADLLAAQSLRVDFFNFPAMNPSGTVTPLPGALSYLAPFLIEGETGRLSFFTHYRRFGPSPEKCVDRIAAAKPDICFFSLFAFCYADDAMALARAVKARLPDVPIVIGGAGASVHPGYFKRESGIDAVLPGEAEVSIPDFHATLRRTGPHETGRAHSGAPLRDPRTMYPPEREMLIPLVKTAESSRSVTFSVSLARGCPKQCDFCSSTLLFGNRLRRGSLDRLDELLAAKSAGLQRPGKRTVINFEDDNLLCDEAYFKAAIKLFRRYIPAVEFIAENGVDYSLLTPERCDWLIDHGFRKFNLSLASIDRDILSSRKRFLDLRRYEETILRLARRAIPTVTYFICGFEEDTVETAARNLVYLADQPTMIGISPFYPVPGLPGFVDRSRIDAHPSVLCCGSSIFPWNGSLTTATMVTAFRLARYLNLKKCTNRSDSENRVIEIIEQEKRLFTQVKEAGKTDRIVEAPGQDVDLVGKVLLMMKLLPT